MIDSSRILAGLASMLWVTLAGAQSAEYLPPPTGPYQSSVVINTMESNSDHETQVYRFPPADLAAPDPDLYPPPADFSRPRSAPASAARGAIEMPAPTPASPPSGDYARELPPAASQNPWGATVQPATPAPPVDAGVWGAAPYGYSAYPYGYYNGYMANPYPVAPSPWAVNPAPAYPGR